ncbi:N-acetylmannosamine-6-phosphate 2-epimerase [Lentibacillus halophilus]|uniref:Putative N-acetylmannosamine-6-phosphate 2-epimerase n=1 Tax=Lentibacillus halophilus TaxID=295065 RepID=A0ABN0Z927_9BACI
MRILDNMKGKLIVSCQALEDEPLHDAYIMSKMALAAKQGGAAGIRANTIKDIQAIKHEVDLPIIGIIKNDHPDYNVFITPTMTEVDALYQEGVDIIAFDATSQKRPSGNDVASFVADIKANYPDQLLMADISTAEEGLNAERIGVDLVASTLAGYTPYSSDVQPMQLVKELTEQLSIPVIAEGNFDTPEKAQGAIKAGAHAVVVGSAITRPQIITKQFNDAVENVNRREVIE